MQDLELGFKNIYDKVDVCAKKMLCEEIEEKWGKTKKVEAWDSDGLSRGICACETREALVSLDLVHTICAQQQLFVLIFIILFMLNLVAEAIWWQIYRRAANIVKVAFGHC